jgi:hypothetical protein
MHIGLDWVIAISGVITAIATVVGVVIVRQK